VTNDGSRDFTPEYARDFVGGIKPERDDRLTEAAKATLRSAYMLADEEYFQDIFARAATAFSGGDRELAARLYDAASLQRLSFATPLLANGGTKRGLPISCFLNNVEDSISGLTANFEENAFMSCNGGGIGTYWGNVRSRGERTSRGVETPGLMPFLHCVDSQALAYHQGSTRRGAISVFLDISHPEVEAFIDMRRPKGDVHLRNENLHHGVNVPDAFMHAVDDDGDWDLVDPHSGRVAKTVKARQLWAQVLERRLERGEPFIHFIDASNRAIPESQQRLSHAITHPNLCTEVLLPTSPSRSAVCCISSINLAYLDEWSDGLGALVHDVVTMLDNALDVFVSRAPPEMARAVLSVRQERAIGLGYMGLHTYMQRQGIAVGDQAFRDKNVELSSRIRDAAAAASRYLGHLRGPAPEAPDGRRHTYLIAIAPNVSSSIINGGVSPGIETMSANAFAKKTLHGTFAVRNPALAELLGGLGQNNEDVWRSIATNDGSVQHLPFLSDADKRVFRTARELDQDELVVLAADRQTYICQGQSLNLFYGGQPDRGQVHKTHMSAWRRGLKTLYYVHSKAPSSTRIAAPASEPPPQAERVPVECTDDVCTVCAD
jgi:ribonucleoside-diphosphate reductase alpha chain